MKQFFWQNWSTLESLIKVPLVIKVPQPKMSNCNNSTTGNKSTATSIFNCGTIAVLLDVF